MGLGRQERPLVASPAAQGGGCWPFLSLQVALLPDGSARARLCRRRSAHAPCHHASLARPAATGPPPRMSWGAGAAAAAKVRSPVRPCGASPPWASAWAWSPSSWSPSVSPHAPGTTACPGTGPCRPMAERSPLTPLGLRPGPTSPVASSLCRSGPCWMPMGAASAPHCPTRQSAPRSPRRGCPGAPRWSHTTSPSLGCRCVSGGPWCPTLRLECLCLGLGSPRRIPVQPVDWKGYPRKPREMSIKHTWWSQLPLWTTGPPLWAALWDSVGQELQTYSTWGRGSWAFYTSCWQSLDRASPGQREPLAKRPSWWQLEVVPGTLEWGWRVSESPWHCKCPSPMIFTINFWEVSWNSDP